MTRLKSSVLAEAVPSGKWLVYLLTNKKNGKRYVGLTGGTLAVRFSQHVKKANAGSKYALHAAMRKYGASAFDSEVLVEVRSLEEARGQEAAFVQKLNTRCGPGLGYNQTAGGEGAAGYKHSEKTRKKMSLIHKGKKISQAHRQSISLRLRNVPKSATHRSKIAAALKNKPKSKVHREKLSAALKGKPRTDLAGELHGQSKLSDAQRFEIYGLRQVTKLSQARIAALYGVSLRAVQKAIVFASARCG